MTAPCQSASTVTGPVPRLAAGPASAGPTALVGRRFRAADVALHLDMEVIGNVCVAITLSGYRSLLDGFLDDTSGSQAALMAALDGGQTDRLPGLAHAVLGAAASLGLRAIGQQARRIESEGARLQPGDCALHAAELRALRVTARALLQRMGFA